MKFFYHLRALPALLTLGAVVSSRSMGAPGDLDSGFGTGGVFTISFGSGDDVGNCIGLQSDGKIVVAGGAAAGGFPVLRLLPDGSPDPDFGTGGKVRHTFGSLERACGVSVVGGGRILVGGAGLVPGGSTDFGAMRLLPNGALDSGYGTGGVVTTDIFDASDEAAAGMVVDGTGRATLAGRYRTNIALVRFTADGEPDPSFGTGGKVFTAGDNTPEQQANAIALQGDGKIVVAGQTRSGANTDILVARYLANGTPDSDFGNGGKTITPIGSGNVSDVANALVVLSNGNILVAGTSGSNYALARYTAGGVLDTDFGDGGGLFIDYGGAVDAGYGLAVQSDGKILLAGTSSTGGRDFFALLRLTSGGDLDSGFGTSGGLLTPVTPGSDSARAITLQSDGRIVVAGSGGALNAKNFAVARYESTGPVPIGEWRQTHFGTTANSGNAANNFDFDKDGLVNLIEYAFGQNPTLAASRTVPSGDVSGANFVSRFTAPASITGVTYAAEWSPSMAAGSWNAVAESGSGRVHVFSVPMTGRTKVFLRWKVSLQ